MTTINAKEILKPISWLIGKWSSIKAHGEFPKIKSFDFYEEVEYKYFGQPLLSYNSRTYLKDGMCTPKHFESGFITILPDSNQVSFLLAHNFGLTTLEEGEVNSCEIKLKTTAITRKLGQKGSIVCEIRRHYKLCNNILHMILYMGTTQKPLTKHLTVVYKKN